MITENFTSTPNLRAKVFRLASATASDRECIYRLRHEVYASELRQHPVNGAGQLTDALDSFNFYLCAWDEEQLIGFVSLTPAMGKSYSIDKYVARERLPFPVDDRLFEVRILTVMPSARGREAAALLMYAALRWVEARGGTRIMAIGRREVLSLYTKAGLRKTGIIVTSGAVTFEVLHATVAELRSCVDQFTALLNRLEQMTDWRLDFPFRKPSACFHGGVFFQAIGERFDALERAQTIINADVLDAWFSPSPKVIDALREHLPWLIRTSPPADAAGLIDVIAERRGVRRENILPGAGSSDLIFLALRHWLNSASRVLLLDPTYGEYAHILEQVIGCRVERLALQRVNNYSLNPDALAEALAQNYDLVILVNPNSPTGQHAQRELLEPILRRTPSSTRVWIDETYVDYVGAGQSLERFAAQSENVIVCKSMSKVYALSGMRVAYLCAPPHQLESLRSLTPPWAVSLPAQVAAVNALQDPAYYATRYAETHQLRRALAKTFAGFGWEIIPGCANFLLVHLPERGPGAADLIKLCRARGLFLRDASSMSARLGNHAVRIAVKDAATNQRMIEIIREVVGQAARLSSGMPNSPALPDRRDAYPTTGFMGREKLRCESQGRG